MYFKDYPCSFLRNNAICLRLSIYVLHVSSSAQICYKSAIYVGSKNRNSWARVKVQGVQHLPCTRPTWVPSLGWKGSLSAEPGVKSSALLGVALKQTKKTNNVNEEKEQKHKAKQNKISDFIFSSWHLVKLF